MPHFEVNHGSDGKISKILKDGKKTPGGFKLEQPQSIVKIYFELAGSNLLQLVEAKESAQKRAFGLQSFIMSLTGLEAFGNTYFRMRGDELSNEAVKKCVDETIGKLTDRLKKLIDLVGDGSLVEQSTLIGAIGRLASDRNALVHPKWVPSSLLMVPQAVHIGGLVESPHLCFENERNCRRALLWCLLFVARVAENRKVPDVDWFIFRWTGIQNIQLDELVSELASKKK